MKPGQRTELEIDRIIVHSMNPKVALLALTSLVRLLIDSMPREQADRLVADFLQEMQGKPND